MVGQTLRERSVLIEGDIALVFGTAELRFAVPGKEASVSTLRYTSTYVKRQGQWRMLALQMQQKAQQWRQACGLTRRSSGRAGSWLLSVPALRRHAAQLGL